MAQNLSESGLLKNNLADVMSEYAALRWSLVRRFPNHLGVTSINHIYAVRMGRTCCQEAMGCARLDEVKAFLEISCSVSLA